VQRDVANVARWKITAAVLDGTTSGVTDSDAWSTPGDGPVYCTGLNPHVTGASETGLSVCLSVSLSLSLSLGLDPVSRFTGNHLSISRARNPRSISGAFHAASARTSDPPIPDSISE